MVTLGSVPCPPLGCSLQKIRSTAQFEPIGRTDATHTRPAGGARQAGPLWPPRLITFLHFCPQQQANLIPGLNLSALGIFSTGLSMLPPPAGPRGVPPTAPYHPFTVSSSDPEFFPHSGHLQAAVLLCQSPGFRPEAVLTGDDRMPPALLRTPHCPINTGC